MGLSTFVQRKGGTHRALLALCVSTLASEGTNDGGGTTLLKRGEEKKMWFLVRGSGVLDIQRGDYVTVDPNAPVREGDRVFAVLKGFSIPFVAILKRSEDGIVLFTNRIRLLIKDQTRIVFLGRIVERVHWY